MLLKNPNLINIMQIVMK